MVARPSHYNTRYKWDLSPKQREVLDLISSGRTNAEIAGVLGVSLDGAKYHVREILAKLDLQSREEAADYWRGYNRPVAKLSRAFGSIFGLGALKAALGAGAVVGAGAAIAGLAVAINASRGADSNAGSPIGDDDPLPAVTATATTTAVTPPRQETPEEFARRISELVTSGRVADVLALSAPPSFTCPGPTPQGAGGPYPLCNGATPGEPRQGYVTVRDASEAETIPAGTFSQRAAETLLPSLALVSIGTPASGSGLVIGFTNAAGGAVYLAFDTPAGSSPALHSMGATTAQAPAIVNGGQAILVPGPTIFQPLS